MFAARRNVIEALLADEEWSRRLEEAETVNEVVQVLSEFCREKGFRAVEV